MAEYTTATNMGKNKEKIKTPFAKIIVNNNPEKTYYNLMWWQDGEMHIGFGSANLSFVRKWLNEEFEVEQPAADVAPVVHGRWDDSGRYTFPSGSTAVRCTNCGCALTESEYRLNNWNYCPVCGAKMDGGADHGKE